MNRAARLSGAGSPFDAWPLAIGYERAPFAAGQAGARSLIAASPGVMLGLFGWSDGSEVSNVYAAGQQLCFILPTFESWNLQRVYPVMPGKAPIWWEGFAPPLPQATIPGFPPFPITVLRGGYECIVASAGVFNTKFPLGGEAGAQVWADPATGLPYGSNVGGNYIATPWTLTQSVSCNGLGRISSFISPL